MLDEYMYSLGYSDEQIDLIKNYYCNFNYDYSNILYNFKNLTNYFHKNGLKNSDIIVITTVIPGLIYTSVEDFKIKVKALNEIGFNKIDIIDMIKKYPYIITLSIQKIYNKINYLNSLGFTFTQIITILIKKTDILSIDNSYIGKRFIFFTGLGYKNKETINLLYSSPDLFDMPINSIKNKYKRFLSLGFKDSEIIKITYYLPELYTYNNEGIESKMKFLTDYGFSNKNIINIIKKFPIILREDYLSNVFNKLFVLEELDFDKKSIVKMINKNGYLLFLSDELIINNYNILIKEGLTNDSFINYPILLGYNVSNLVEKIKYYKKNTLFNIVKENAYYLLYNLSLIKKRYDFLKRNKYDINDVFIYDSTFKAKYNITRNELLKGV